MLRFARDMGLSLDKVNVNGGAIALGHPLGATGAMILGTLIDELERRDQRYGLATLCVGGGMGSRHRHRTPLTRRPARPSRLTEPSMPESTTIRWEQDDRPASSPSYSTTPTSPPTP